METSGPVQACNGTALALPLHLPPLYLHTIPELFRRERRTNYFRVSAGQFQTTSQFISATAITNRM